MPHRDAVDDILEQWRRERPDLDTSPMAVIGRISRLAVRLDSLLRPVFRERGLAPGEFDMLATLRRSGPDNPLSPSELTASMMVSSGAATKRIDRLERAGLVRRSQSPDDGRGRLISLTPEGAALVDEAIAVHVANEGRLLSALDQDERTALADLLRRLENGLPD